MWSKQISGVLAHHPCTIRRLYIISYWFEAALTVRIFDAYSSSIAVITIQGPVQTDVDRCMHGSSAYSNFVFKWRVSQNLDGFQASVFVGCDCTSPLGISAASVNGTTRKRKQVLPGSRRETGLHLLLSCSWQNPLFLVGSIEAGCSNIEGWNHLIYSQDASSLTFKDSIPCLVQRLEQRIFRYYYLILFV